MSNSLVYLPLKCITIYSLGAIRRENGKEGMMEIICILYGFSFEMDFSPRVSEWDSETSGEKSISHGKPYKMHFLAYFTLQGTLVMLNTLRKVEDHENHVGFISQLFSTWGKVRSM